MKTLSRKDFSYAVQQHCPMVETASGEDVAIPIFVAMDWFDRTVASQEGYGYVRILQGCVYLGVETWPGSENIYRIGGEQ